MYYEELLSYAMALKIHSASLIPILEVDNATNTWTVYHMFAEKLIQAIDDDDQTTIISTIESIEFCYDTDSEFQDFDKASGIVDDNAELRKNAFEEIGRLLQEFLRIKKEILEGVQC